MIWFGNLEHFFAGPVPADLPATPEDQRMLFALRRVAELAPGLSGAQLLGALASTGWVDRSTAERLLPTFRHFDPDQHFCEYLRRLSFRGASAEEPFRDGIRCVLDQVVGPAAVDPEGPEPCVRFRVDGFEGLALARPEVSFTITGRTRDAILAAVEEMPDALVVVARNFDRVASQQLSGLLHRTGVRGTLVTLNLLLGIRATALRYQPERTRVVELLGRGGTLRSADVARLGDREPAQRFHMPGWNSSSTV